MMTSWLLLSLALATQDAPVAEPPPTHAPVEAAPVEAAPVEAAPVEAAPVEAAPIEAAPVEAKAAPLETAPLKGEEPVQLGREGVLALGAGLGFALTSMAAFSVGFEAERQLRAGEVRGEAADQALTQRAVAAWLAWPAAVLSVVGVAGGAYLIATSEEDVDASARSAETATERSAATTASGSAR